MIENSNSCTVPSAHMSLCKMTNCPMDRQTSLHGLVDVLTNLKTHLLKSPWETVVVSFIHVDVRIPTSYSELFWKLFPINVKAHHTVSRCFETDASNPVFLHIVAAIIQALIHRKIVFWFLKQRAVQFRQKSHSNFVAEERGLRYNFVKGRFHWTCRTSTCGLRGYIRCFHNRR